MGHEFKNGDKVIRSYCDGTPHWLAVFVGIDPRDPRCAVVSYADHEKHPGFGLDSAPLAYLRPHKEPFKASGWVNVYEGNVYASREGADLAAKVMRGIERLYCIYVTGTEGEEP